MLNLSAIHGAERLVCLLEHADPLIGADQGELRFDVSRFKVLQEVFDEGRLFTIRLVLRQTPVLTIDLKQLLSRLGLVCFGIIGEETQVCRKPPHGSVTPIVEFVQIFRQPTATHRLDELIEIVELVSEDLNWILQLQGF